jgi:hypothetical protein
VKSIHQARAINPQGVVDATIAVGVLALSGGGAMARLVPVCWMAGLNGEVSLRGFAAPVDASFIDILESSDSSICATQGWGRGKEDDGVC